MRFASSIRLLKILSMGSFLNILSISNSIEASDLVNYLGVCLNYLSKLVLKSFILLYTRDIQR